MILSVLGRKKEGTAQGLQVTHKPTSGVGEGGGLGQKRIGVCLQKEKSLQGGGCPQGQLLRAQILLAVRSCSG